MQTNKLALLSTMLIGIGGAALAAETTDAAEDAVQPATEQAAAGQQATSGAAEQTAATGEAALAQRHTPSVGTSNQAPEGAVLAGMTAEDVIGMPVVDANGEEVGEIADLLITNDGTIDRAIVDVGGFLGLATKPVALDVTSLTVAEGDGEIVSDVNVETLESMPEWQQDDAGWFTF